jgi:hypothetical protein
MIKKFSSLPPEDDDFLPKPEYPARLIRFVTPSALNVSSPSIVAVYDPINNLVRIDQELFKKLDPSQQNRVMFTRAAYVEVKYRGSGPLAINEVFT